MALPANGKAGKIRKLEDGRKRESRLNLQFYGLAVPSWYVIALVSQYAANEKSG